MASDENEPPLGDKIITLPPPLPSVPPPNHEPSSEAIVVTSADELNEVTLPLSDQSSSRPQSIIIKPIGVNLFQRPLASALDCDSQQATELADHQHHDQPITMKIPLAANLSSASSSSSNGKSSDISLSTLSNSHGNNQGAIEEVTIFSELSQLCPSNKDGHQLAWKETARWVIYEENVEENGTRWSKPYVSTVNLSAFLELKHSFTNGIVILDSASTTLDHVVEEFLQLLRIKNLVSNDEANQIYQLLLLQKRHLFQTKRSLISSIADLRQNSSNNFLKLISRSSSKINCANVDPQSLNASMTLAEDGDVEEGLGKSEMTRSQSNYNLKNNGKDVNKYATAESGGNGSLTKNSFSSSNLTSTKLHSDQFKFNNAFLKKIPLNALSNNILIAEVDFLSAPISGFIRLQEASRLGDITEVSIPTKFIYIYLGPKPIPSAFNYVQIGRALATLMSDSVFRSVALRTQSVESLLVAIDEFLGEAPILPPNLWDPATRIEPPDKPPTAHTRKNNSFQTLSNAANHSQLVVNDIKTTSQSYCNHAFDHEQKDNSNQNGGHHQISTNLPNGNGNGGNWNHNNGKGHYFLTDKIELDSDDEEEMEREKMGLVRSGRLFGGLINDIKRKLPHYKSDFTDAFALQSIASIIFLYFACLTPIITFGGLLGDATGNNIATMESLVCGAICGILYGFFSGQPLTILGSTGPVLVFETIVYDFCNTHGYNYLSLRFWIGMWTAAFLFIFVAIDASYLVCFITRFTEENFASLISVIFIYKAIEKLFDIQKYYPLNMNPDKVLNYECSCMYPNVSNSFQVSPKNSPNATAMDECLRNGGILFGSGCITPSYVPDVFLFSIILLLFTFIISIKLKDFRNTRFFGAKTRELISDFAVPIAITLMTLIDNLIGVKTPKLHVPSDFNPTLSSRSWMVEPFPTENPIWVPVLSFFPALLATILIFMDQQITAVIINRKEHKLKKGCGYHLDLFVLCFLIVICSFFGLPWFVAATVLSITHVNSLTTHSESAAPGDKPKFLGVREQRVTHIAIFVLCGLSIFFTSVLQRIPMPVLYGVFLYMGISSLKGSQFVDRMLIMFMPPKYQPDYMFLRRVNIYRVHLFTLIQFICFVFLWVVKSYKPISITFPLMLLVILSVRKLLDYFFSQEELKILDDKMPESKRKKKERQRAKLEASKLQTGEL